MAKRKSQVVTVPSHTYVDTSDPNLKKFCGRDGNWTHYWIENEKKFVKAVNHILRLGYPKPGLQEWLKNTTAEEAERRLMVGGDEGRRVHQAIRDLAAGNRVTMSLAYTTDLGGKAKQVLNDDEWFNLQTYVAFAERYKMALINEEFSVSDGYLGYAGTADRLCLLLVPEDDKNFPAEFRGKQVLVLIDWKTSGRLYGEYKLQVSAYWRRVQHMPQFAPYVTAFAGQSFGVLVRLGTKHKCGYEVQVLSEADMDSKFQVFLGCISTANDLEPEFTPEIIDIPTEFYSPLKMATVPVIPTDQMPLPLPEVAPAKKKVRRPRKSKK